MTRRRLSFFIILSSAGLWRPEDYFKYWREIWNELPTILTFLMKDIIKQRVRQLLREKQINDHSEHLKRYLLVSRCAWRFIRPRILTRWRAAFTYRRWWLSAACFIIARRNEASVIKALHKAMLLDRLIEISLAHAGRHIGVIAGSTFYQPRGPIIYHSVIFDVHRRRGRLRSIDDELHADVDNAGDILAILSYTQAARRDDEPPTAIQARAKPLILLRRSYRLIYFVLAHRDRWPQVMCENE